MPSSAQARRHSWSSQRPVTFRRRRTVSSTPPSLVMFAANEASVITGSSTSRPTSDHVPTLTKTESERRKGTAATAEPVSWVATATTSDPSRCVSSATEAASAPRRVPGSTTSGRSRAGTSSRSTRSLAQPRVRASKHCVVLAFVRSELRTPQSHECTRSGISRIESAASSAGSGSPAIAASSKIVLIGSSWMPVRS